MKSSSSLVVVPSWGLVVLFGVWPEAGGHFVDGQVGDGRHGLRQAPAAGLPLALTWGVLRPVFRGAALAEQYVTLGRRTRQTG